MVRESRKREQDGGDGHQGVEGEEDGEGGEGVEATVEEEGAIVGDDKGVVGDADDAEDEEDHDRSQASEGGAELEDVPRHGRSRSVHI